LNTVKNVSVSWHVLLLLLGVQQCIVTGEANLQGSTKAQLGSAWQNQTLGIHRKDSTLKMLVIKC
jgi:hypothetical protein